MDLATIYVKVRTARFSSMGFITSGFTFRSLTHFEFIFICGVNTCSNVIVLHIVVQFFQHHFLKSYNFSIAYSRLCCQR